MGGGARERGCPATGKAKRSQAVERLMAGVQYGSCLIWQLGLDSVTNRLTVQFFFSDAPYFGIGLRHEPGIYLFTYVYIRPLGDLWQAPAPAHLTRLFIYKACEVSPTHTLIYSYVYLLSGTD